MSQSGIPEIIEELNIENGNLYKMGVLKKYSDNELLKRVLKMTYDKTTYTYGVRKVMYYQPLIQSVKYTLEQALDFLKNRLDKAIMSVIKIQEDLILEYGEYSEDSYKDMYSVVELGFLDSQIKYLKKEISKIDKVYEQLEKKNARK